MADNSTADHPGQGRLILHIGFHNTEASAIQEVMHSSSIMIRDQGVVYPEPSNQYPSHLDLAVAFGFDSHLSTESTADPAELIERYARICRDVGPERAVVISSEQFCTASDNVAAFKRLEKFVTALPLTPTILAVVRPPIEFVISRYHDHLVFHDNSGGHGELDFRAWIDSRPWGDEPVPWFAFEKRLEIWRDHFDDVRVVDFSELTAQSTSVIGGVLQTAGLHCEVDRPNHRANVGFHPFLADAVRGLRATGMDQGEVQEAIDQLLRIGSRLPRVDAGEYYLGAQGKAALVAVLEAEVAALEERTGVPA